MKTVTLTIDDSVNDKFIWLLEHFASSGIRILDQSEYINDDEYLRSLGNVVQSIKDARNESIDNAVTLDKLEW